MSKNRIPTPLYAVAGAGDLAYQRLRKLPATVTELRDKAAETTIELRQRARSGELRAKAVNTLRAAAARIAAALVAGVHAAQERAIAVYDRLVAHGERVLDGDGGRSGGAEAQPPASPAAIEATADTAGADGGSTPTA